MYHVYIIQISIKSSFYTLLEKEANVLCVKNTTF